MRAGKRRDVLKSVYFSAYLCLAFNIQPCEKKLLSLSHLLFGSSVESNRRSCIAELTFDLPGSRIRTRHRAVPCLLRLYSLHIINLSTISNFTLQRAPSQKHTHTHSLSLLHHFSLPRSPSLSRRISFSSSRKPFVRSEHHLLFREMSVFNRSQLTAYVIAR